MPRRLMDGVVTWDSETTAMTVLAIHYSSDPDKDAAWAAKVSAKYGGISSPEHQQEYEMNVDAYLGRSVYWGFNPTINIIPIEKVWSDMKLPRMWEKWLSFDFGQTDATAILFWTKDPRSGIKYIYDELYLNHHAFHEIQLRVYEKMSHWLDIPLADLNIEDWLTDNVGDPQGKVYMENLALGDMPIYIRGNMKGAPKLNDPRVGEHSLNSAFLPQFRCCGKVQRSSGLVGTCTVTAKQDGQTLPCGKVHPAHPNLVILSVNGQIMASNLVRQLPTIQRLEARSDEAEPPERNKQVEDHAVDSAKYGMMRDTEELTFGELKTHPLLDVPEERLTLEQMAMADRMRKSGVRSQEEWAEPVDVASEGDIPFTLDEDSPFIIEDEEDDYLDPIDLF